MQFKIRLPEDNEGELAVVGRFIQLGRLPDGTQAVGVLPTESQFVGGYRIQRGQPIKLVPLAVITDSTNALVYNPRDHVSDLDEQFRQWLVEHPEWPGDFGQLSAVEAP